MVGLDDLKALFQPERIYDSNSELITFNSDKYAPALSYSKARAVPGSEVNLSESSKRRGGRPSGSRGHGVLAARREAFTSWGRARAGGLPDMAGSDEEGYLSLSLCVCSGRFLQKG